MFVEERLNQILQTLDETGQVDVYDLSRKFHVTKETIRRDLKRLEKDNKLIRTYGGAILTESDREEKRTIVSNELPANIRAGVNVEEKKKIGKLAASYIKDGDTIFVDNSTTCIYMYPFVPKDIQVTIITNSLQFVIESMKITSPLHTIVFLGGILKLSNLSLYGSMTMKNAQEHFPNKAFISCTGILSENQLTDVGFQEIDVKRYMTNAAREVFLLADYSKFRTGGQVYLAGLDDVDCLITDEKADFGYLGLSEENKKKIIIAK